MAEFFLSFRPGRRKKKRMRRRISYLNEERKGKKAIYPLAGEEEGRKGGKGGLVSPTFLAEEGEVIQVERECLEERKEKRFLV